MANTVSRKRSRTNTQRRAPRSSRVGNLTLGEFREMMTDIIDKRLAEWIDPDAGLELRPEVVERIARQRADFAAGKRGKSLEEIASKYNVEP